MKKTLIAIIIAILVIATASTTIFAAISSANTNSSTPEFTHPNASEATTDEVVTDEVVTDEVVTDEVVTDKVVTDEVVTDEVVTDEAVTDEVVTDEVVTDEVATDEVVTDEVVTDEVVTDEVVTDEVATDEVATDEVATDEVATDEVVTEPAHICEIVRATERYHRYSCDECENYSRVNHTEENMAIRDNGAFFHIRSCEGCGYEYAEKHNYRYGYKDNGTHYEKCLDCGHESAESAHTMVNRFYGYKHEIECDECPATLARHIGVTYTVVDAKSCQATCDECGATEIIEHEWDGFECVNCGFKVGLFSVGVIVDAQYVKTEDYEFLCELELLVNDVYVYVNVDANNFQSWNCDEGDFILIFHQGNDIYDISQLVDSEVVYDPENFTQYAYEDLIPNVDELAFEDIVIDDIYYSDDEVFITFGSGRVADVTTPYVVYDLRDTTMYDIYEGNAVLTYCPFGTMTYIVVIW